MKNYVDYYVHFTEYRKEINAAAQKEPAELIEQMESLYAANINNIAKFIINGAPGNKALMLAGPSSSGKTTTAAMLCKSIEAQGARAIRVSLDDFYLEDSQAPIDEFGEPDFECIESLDVPLMRKCVEDMMSKGECVIPRFDFKTKTRSFDGEHIRLSGSDIVIIEGLHALNPQITDCLPDEKLLKVYCSVKQGISETYNRLAIRPHELRLIRRIVRDNQFRNMSADDTISMWPSVRRGEIKHNRPYKRLANVTINSLHIYEPCVLAPKALPLLEQIDPQSKNGAEAKKLADKLKKFTHIDEAAVPENSLMREFIGGGIYS